MKHRDQIILEKIIEYCNKINNALKRYNYSYDKFNEDDILDGVAELIIKEQHDLENAGNLEKELIDSKRGIIKENLKKKIHFVKMSIEY